MKAEYLELQKVVGLPRNAKDHDISEVSSSMKRFGFLERVIINAATGHLIAGHGRVETLRKLKARGSAPPVNIKVDGDTWYVPCDFVDIPAAEEEAAAIALNRLVERGGWNEPMLTSVLSDLAAQGADMLDGLGFDTDDLDKMLSDLGGPDEQSSSAGDDGEDQPEDFAEQMLAKWGVLDGDIWQVGEHLVACGSCRNDELVAKLCGEQRINVAITSPPYAEQRKDQYGGVSEAEYVDWWSQVQAVVSANLATDGGFFVNIKPHARDGQRSLYVHDLVSAMVRKWDWRFVDEFCWQRISAPGSWPNRFKNGFEPVYHFSRGSQIKFRPQSVGTGEGGSMKMGYKNANMGDYYNTADGQLIEWDSALPSNVLPTFGNAAGWGQAAAYPIGLPQFFILAFSDQHDLIYDPFAGSGTTGVAAHNHQRQSILVEKLPKYTAIILERMQDVTGEEPERIKHG